MKKYVKPDIDSVDLAVNGSICASSCLVQADMDLIASILGGGLDPNAIFGMYESCTTQVPIDMYCKFSSVELGAMSAFVS